ncbi:MAG: ubiquinone biosynthesis accessory factor UbiJ [Panacagrimonas sp.]
MTPSILCAAAEIALNRYLRLEASVLDECTKLDGRCMEFFLPSAGLGLAIEFIPSGVRVMPHAPRGADVQVTGTPTALIASLRHVAGAQPGLPAGLVVEGDAELLNQFRAMVARVGFDPEEWLAPMLGGVAAHRLVGGLKKMLSWTRGNSRRMADNTAEYLREETYDLARGRDVGEWMNEVDDARESLDRLEARLRRLESGPSSA